MQPYDGSGNRIMLDQVSIPVAGSTFFSMSQVLYPQLRGQHGYGRLNCDNMAIWSRGWVTHQSDERIRGGSSRLLRERNAFDKVTDARPCLRVIIASVERVFCCINYPDRTWATPRWEPACSMQRRTRLNGLRRIAATSGTARRFNVHDEILRIGVGMAPDRWYRVRSWKGSPTMRRSC